MAYPRKEIEREEFEKLCGLQCTEEEISGWFQTTPKTLNGWCKRTYHKQFKDVFEEFRGNGRIALRRAQMQCAENGSATMLIWLGKQYLKQTDSVDVRTTSTQEREKDPLTVALERYESGDVGDE